ncbi:MULTISPECIES: hypothetical protein [unclassified Corallococcus]|uniref:hypothetical protein n=1 Tax=unclassified Corallococcus TaxID=2685029 RepID=UPI001F5C0EDE|nr:MULTISPECIES: hypothetical protein [unclassified Corallococcus]WAS86423.1 hypothetical protein O0N60_05480 [Corallococcus sp. NCRR]
MTRPWHVPLSLVACFVLLAPALFVLRQVREAGASSIPEPEGLVPMLTYDERMRRVTYHYTCSKQTDCEAPLVCYRDVRFRRYCTDSACTTDSQCPEGQRCTSLPVLSAGGVLVRLCALVGIRQEGEPCLETAFDATSACRAESECVGRDGYCARACTPGQPGTCSEGFFCADVKPKPSCLPTCEERGCPQGERCVPFEEGTSICASIHGPNCLDTPCPDGRKCEWISHPEFPGKVWAECVHRCSETNPTCGEGQVCDRYHCLQACDPDEPNPCDEGFHCDRRGEKLPWSCQPDYWHGP